MNDHSEKLPKESGAEETPREEDPNFLYAERSFDTRIKPGID